MQIYPAIDLYQGQVVRLKRGDFSDLTVYSSSPAGTAIQWEEEGARWLHVVDLEGAKSGSLKNLPALVQIRQAVNCKIQFGGGIRNLADIELLIEEGVDRVVIGTKVLDEKFLQKIVERFGGKIAAGLDIRDGMVRTAGWLQTSNVTFERALVGLNKCPLETIVYTDITKDGMLQGPNLEGLAKVLAGTHAWVLLSGGISTLQDIAKCRDVKNKNFEGVIIGKALYDKKFSLREALGMTRSSEETHR